MHRFVRVRLGGLTVVAVTGVVAIGAAFALPASAATVKTACSSATIKIKGTGTLSKCTNLKGTGGSATLVVNTSKAPYAGTFTWNKTGTTKASLTYGGAPAGAPKVCPTGTTEIDVKGTVTGGTGAAIKSIPKGAKVSAKLCYKASTGALTLAPKTTFNL